MRHCTSCDTSKDLAHFLRTGERGRHYKTCAECRAKQRVRQAERRKPHAGRPLGRNKGTPQPQCADCDAALTPNRTILLDGLSLCYGCRAKRFGHGARYEG